MARATLSAHFCLRSPRARGHDARPVADAGRLLPPGDAVYVSPPVAAMSGLTVQSIRRVLKAVRLVFLGLFGLVFVYFLYTMASLGGASTLDVLGATPSALLEDRR